MHIFFGGWYRFFVGFNAPKQFLLFFRELQLYETTEATLRVPNLSTKTLSNLFLTVNSKLYKLNLCLAFHCQQASKRGKNVSEKTELLRDFRYIDASTNDCFALQLPNQMFMQQGLIAILNGTMHTSVSKSFYSPSLEVRKKLWIQEKRASLQIQLDEGESSNDRHLQLCKTPFLSCLINTI